MKGKNVNTVTASWELLRVQCGSAASTKPRPFPLRPWSLRNAVDQDFRCRRQLLFLPKLIILSTFSLLCPRHLDTKKKKMRMKYDCGVKDDNTLIRPRKPQPLQSQRSKRKVTFGLFKYVSLTSAWDLLEVWRASSQAFPTMCLASA